MSDEMPIAIDYELTFADGETVRVAVRLDAGTLSLVKEAHASLPEWTRRSSIACAVCPLPIDADATCPVAANLSELVGRFGKRYSYDRVTLKVTTAERAVLGQTTLQAALASLTGLVMVTSGCPIMDKLRPMARFHLPLASEHETIYRAVSMFLVAQFLRAQAGQTPDWSIAGLDEVYGQVHQVNLALSRRLREAAARDASANALIRLDLFTDGVAHSIRDRLGELTHLFESAYLR
jgi:hypothetical protein